MLSPDSATSCSVVPAFRNGQPLGFKLFAIRAGSLPAALGLANGDVVTHVNGLELRSPDDALAVYTQLRGARDLSVRLLRDGAEVTREFVIE